MEKNVYLNEEKYQKTKKKLSLVATLILIIGLCVGGYLIYNGIAKPNSSKVETLQKTLEEKKKELEDKGIVYESSAEYTDGDAYDLKIITDALDPSFNNCAFDEYKNNSITKEYCSAKNSVGSFASISLIMFGAFICVATCMIAGSIYMSTKRREIMAYNVQQVMPVAQEGIEKMAPTIGKAGGEIVKTMAPAYGEVAKEISKGIKEGIKDDEE